MFFFVFVGGLNIEDDRSRIQCLSARGIIRCITDWWDIKSISESVAWIKVLHERCIWPARSICQLLSICWLSWWWCLGVVMVSWWCLGDPLWFPSITFVVTDNKIQTVHLYCTHTFWIGRGKMLSMSSTNPSRVLVGWVAVNNLNSLPSIHTFLIGCDKILHAG